MGWDPLDDSWWPSIADSLVKPWPRDAVLMDLRWWASRERRGVQARPGRVHLQARWGWTEWQTKQALKAEDEWGDPMLARAIPPTDLPSASQAPPTERPESERNPALHLVAPPTDLPPTSQVPPTDLPTRDGDHRTHNTDTDTGEGQNKGDPPGDREATPGWARKHQPPAGMTRRDLVAVVVGCKEAILAKPVNPERCGADAGPILALWRADGERPPPEFVADFALVVEAARDCPLPLFARDLRAEGWAEGTDRSRSIPTLCVQQRWPERLEAARSWVANGRPPPSVSATGPPARAAPASPLDNLRRLAAKEARLNPPPAVRPPHPAREVNPWPADKQ